jgi:hypothetical protein
LFSHGPVVEVELLCFLLSKLPRLVVSVVVVVSLENFLPVGLGLVVVVVVVHFHSPRTFSHPAGPSGAANAERALTEMAVTRKAANATIIMMRFIFPVSFSYTHLTPMALIRYMG